MKKNSYKFIWHENSKYGEPFSRTTWITTAGDRAAAVNLFMKTNGSLKKNTVDKVEEYSSQGMKSFIPSIVKNNGHDMLQFK